MPTPNSSTPPAAVYEENIRENNARIRRLKKADRTFVAAKFVLIAGGLLAVSHFFPQRLVLSAAALTASIAVLTAVFAAHESVLQRIRLHRIYLRINERELEALAGRFPSDKDGGEEFADSGHAFSSDLDLFGPHSLFQFIDRTGTGPGRKILARRLIEPLRPQEIPETQKAVRELSAKVAFRQTLQALAYDRDGFALSKSDRLLRLIEEPVRLIGRRSLIVLIHIVPLITLSALAAWIMGKAPLFIGLGLVLCQTLINAKSAKTIRGAAHRTAAADFNALKAYSRIFRILEKEPFAGTLLRDIQQTFDSGASTASKAVNKLAVLMELLDTRSGEILHLMLNQLLFWDLHWIFRIEKWKKAHASRFSSWFDAVGAMETLSSFANLSFNNPSWIFPRVSDDGVFFKAVDMGHPLLPPAERIDNDFVMPDRGHLAIITGPNMAGKSTFVRTVGTNAALAFAGSPVCASDLELSPFRLITSMKTSDSLDRSLSLFYAELERLKLILDAPRDGPPVFFIIDEMLKGTNAVDRHKGSVALVRQLLRSRATGIVATHDLELARLEEELAGVRNYHFDSVIAGDRLQFDFKLKPGVCRSSNAVVLMRHIGIDI